MIELIRQYKIIEHMAKCKLYVRIGDTDYLVEDIIQQDKIFPAVLSFNV